MPRSFKATNAGSIPASPTMIKNFLRSLLRTRLLKQWNYGCSCSNGVCSSVALNPRNTVTLQTNNPTHEVLLLGDDKAIADFIESALDK